MQQNYTIPRQIYYKLTHKSENELIFHCFILQDHTGESAVFFDFLGLCFIHYSKTTGIFLNTGVAAAAFILIFISMWRMAAVSNVSFCHVACWFTLVLIIQVISFVLGLALPLIVSYVMDDLGLSLVFYSTPILEIGLYVCPSLIGLSLPITIYYALQGNVSCQISSVLDY